VTEMDCRKIEQLISPYIDQELTRAEADMVRVHLSGCTDCQKEYEDLVRLSSVMQNLKQAVVPAPPGFSAAVMQRIRQEEKVAPLPRKTGWLRRNWKQTVAGIAAAAMLLAGTFMNNAGPLVQIADNPWSLVQPDNPTAGPNNTDTPVDGQPGTNGDAIPGTGNQPGGNNGDGTPITPNTTNPDSRPPLILANKDRALTTTLLEIKAHDAYQAQQQALSLAGRYQAQVRNLGQQMNENGSFTVFKITVSKSQAAELISGLVKLGQVDNKEVTKTDLNTQFADKLSQYRNLVAQRATLENEGDLAAMDARIAALETELTNWDKQAEQETIVLWLQK